MPHTHTHTKPKNTEIKKECTKWNCDEARQRENEM